MKPYSTDLRKRVINAVNHDQNTPKEAATRFAIGIATVYRYIQLERDLHDLTPLTSPGRPRIITPSQEEQLLEQIQTHNDFTLEEHSVLWQEQTGQAVTRATMHNSLQRLKITRKKRQSKPKNATNSNV
jgi:transposase